jgi:RNA polymerase sigma-70 factor (ECF subfamily)
MTPLRRAMREAGPRPETDLPAPPGAGLTTTTLGPEAVSSSFEQLFNREYRQVVGLAALLVGDRSQAEDLAQDAFAAAYRHWATVSQYDEPGAWVRRVVANRAASSVRRRVREGRAIARLGRRRHPNRTDPPVERNEFWTAVRSLPKRQAQCVALFYLDDRSVSDIASLLELAASTVRVHLHQGRIELGRRLGESVKDDE